MVCFKQIQANFAGKEGSGPRAPPPPVPAAGASRPRQAGAGQCCPPAAGRMRPLAGPLAGPDAQHRRGRKRWFLHKCLHQPEPGSRHAASSHML